MCAIDFMLNQHSSGMLPASEVDTKGTKVVEVGQLFISQHFPYRR